MTWLKEVSIHDCPLPRYLPRTKIGPADGSIWQCDDCLQVWNVLAGEWQKKVEPPVPQMPIPLEKF